MNGCVSVGNKWVIFDDETEREVGSYPDRKTAWDKQRLLRRSKESTKKQSEAERERQRKAGKAKVEKKPGIKRSKGTLAIKKEHLDFVKRIATQVLKENFLNYVFEQPQTDKAAQMWDNFIENLPDETIMSDPKLKNTLISLAKSESKVLQKAMKEVQSVLAASGFKVKAANLQKDPQTQEMKMMFSVTLKENGKTLPFSLKIENGRPLVVIPDETRNILNTLNNNESKLIRSELIHSQETILDNMDDLVNLADKRNKYLHKVEEDIDKWITQLNPLQISMLRFSLKNKYKGIK